MSANRLKNPKQKFDDLFKKELTPKASQPSPKVSSVYSSFRGGLTMKPDLTPKSKIVRPSTSKNNSNLNENFFHNRDDKKTSANSTKKFGRDEVTRKSPITTQYEYQPRAKSKSPIKQSEEIVKHEIEVKYPSNVPLFRDVKVYNNERP